MSYHQITSDERYLISKLRQQGCTQTAIARCLGRHRSSVSREIRRNATAADGCYRPFTASERTRGRRSRSRRNTRFTSQQWGHVHRALQRQWSPEQIAGRLRREGAWTISHETIYAHIWYDKARGGQLFQDLRCATKQRRKRHGTYDSRGRLAGKRMIGDRPAVVETRRELGHWEVDTVVGVGAPDCVATLVERKTGFTMLGKLRNRTSQGMTRRLRRLIRRAPRAFKTLTADNGTPNSMTTRRWKPRRTSGCTSPRRTMRGSAAATRTSTASCGSTYRNGPAWPASLKASATSSPIC